MANEEKDILLSVGIDLSSLNEARQQILSAFTGLTIPVSLAPAASVTQDAQRIRQEIASTIGNQPIDITTRLAPGSRSRARSGLAEQGDDLGDLDKELEQARKNLDKYNDHRIKERSKADADEVKSAQKAQAEIRKSAEIHVKELSGIYQKGTITDAKFRAGQYRKEHTDRVKDIQREAKELTEAGRTTASDREKELFASAKAEAKIWHKEEDEKWKRFIKRTNEEVAVNQKMAGIVRKFNEESSDESFKTIANNIKKEEGLREQLALKTERTQKSLADLQITKVGKFTPEESARIQTIGQELAGLGMIKGKSAEVLQTDLARTNALRKELEVLRQQVRMREAVARAAKIPAERGLVETAGHIFKRALLWSSVFTIAYGTIRTLQGTAGEVAKQFLAIDEAVIILKRDLNIAEKDMARTLGTALYAAEATAVAYGKTIKDVILVQDKFAKQGLSMVDILKATEATLIGSATAMTTTEDAAQILSTTMLTFKLSASETINVFDKLNEVSKKFNITAKDLGTALQHTGGAAQQAGLTLDSTIGLITVIAEATGRAGAEIGNAVRTMSSFVYRPDTVKGLAAVGVAVMNADRSFRSMEDIIGTLARRWEVLTDAEQQNVIQLMAGTLRREQLLAIMNNYPRFLSASAISAASFTSALDEMADVMSTTNFHGQQLRAAIGELAVSLQELGTTSVVNTFLDYLTSGIERIAMAMRGLSAEVSGLKEVLKIQGEEALKSSTELWKPLTPQLQALLLIQKTLRSNKEITKAMIPDILLQLAKTGGISKEWFEALRNTKDFRSTLLDTGRALDTAVIPAMKEGVHKQREINEEYRVSIENLKRYRDKAIAVAEAGAALEGMTGAQRLGSEEAARYKKLMADAEAFRIEIGSGASPANIKAIDAAIAAAEVKLSSLNQAGTSAEQVLSAVSDASKTMGEAIEDTAPKIGFASKALDAYKDKLKEAREVFGQVRDMSQSPFERRQTYISTLLKDTDAVVAGLNAELSAIDRKKKEDLDRLIDTREEADARARITAEIAKARKHQKDLSDLSRETQGIVFDLANSTGLLIEKSKPLENLFGNKLQHNLDVSKSALSVVEKQLKQIQDLNIDERQNFLSEEDLKLLAEKTKLEALRAQIKKDIFQTENQQFAESLRIRQLTLRGLTQEQALISEINRLSAGGEIEPAVEKAKELIDYQFTKAEKMVSSISDGISTGLTDAMLAAPGEADDAFRNMFKSIFSDLMKDELTEQIRALVGGNLRMTQEGEVVANLIQNAMRTGGMEAANAIRVAMGGGPLDYTPAGISGGGAGKAGNKSWFANSQNAALASTFALGAIDAAQTKDFSSLIGMGLGALLFTANPLLGAALGGALGGLFGKKPKKQDPIPTKEPMLEVVHRDLEYVNRNLVALRKPLELFALPASYYFSQRPATGVQMQGMTVNVYGVDATSPNFDRITDAIVDAGVTLSKRALQGV